MMDVGARMGHLDPEFADPSVSGSGNAQRCLQDQARGARSSRKRLRYWPALRRFPSRASFSSDQASAS
jgi:hypothetical protein